MNLHPQARTTPKIRAEIQTSTHLGQKALAEKYNVRKWQNRDQTTLSEAQENIVVELRKTLFLPLDDLLVITREFIHPAASRSGLNRTLAQYGVSNLHDMKKTLQGLCPRLCSHRYQIPAADGRRNSSAIFVCGHRPRFALGAYGEGVAAI